MHRWLRRLALVYVLAALFALLSGVLAAAANAATLAAPGTVDGWFQSVPVPLIAGVLLANAIPYLSALLTREPGWWTGIATMGLAFLDGLLSAIANSGSPVNWRTVFGTALSAWLVAAVHHRFVLSGTKVQTRLHALPKARVTTETKTAA